MISPLFYSYFDNFSFVSGFSQDRVTNISPAMAWIAFRKIPENPIVTPNTTTQVITASSVNRYLQSVTVNPVSTNTTA